jgi:hypothetical protein
LEPFFRIDVGRLGEWRRKMAESNEEWIRRRAYELWEAEGYPTGKDAEHWEQAKLEYVTQNPASAGSGKSRRKANGAAEAPAQIKSSSAKATSSKTAAPKAAGKAAAGSKPTKPADVAGAAAKTTSPKENSSKAAAAKTTPVKTSAAKAPKTPAASVLEPEKKRPKKVAAGS